MAKEIKKIEPAKTWLRGERVTEKAMNAQTAKSPVYAFLIEPAANKLMVRREIEKTYGVKPLKVNIVNRAAKKIMVRGRAGYHGALKKVYVFLKPGDKLEVSKKS